MKIGIVDDLMSDAALLRSLMEDWLHTNCIDAQVMIYPDGESLLDEYFKNNFAVIFLDILLEEGKLNGIRTASKIREVDQDVSIVFITCEKSYALDSYSVHAADYLIKPISQEKLAAVMTRLVKNSTPPPALLEIVENRITIQIPLNHILYIASANRAMEVHTINRVHRTYMTLTEISKQLIKFSNFRNCYRGILVNLDQVKDIDVSDFILSNDERIPISRYKRQAMREAYTLHLFTRIREGGFPC